MVGKNFKNIPIFLSTIALRETPYIIVRPCMDSTWRREERGFKCTSGNKVVWALMLWSCSVRKRCRLMGQTCEDCEYFVIVSSFPTRHIWGDCMKPGISVGDSKGNETSSVFTWGDRTCRDFRPRTKQRQMQSEAGDSRSEDRSL